MVSGLAVNPLNADELWIGFTYDYHPDVSVCYSNDGGLTWSIFNEGDHPKVLPVNDLEYDYVDNRLYMANDRGIFFYDMKTHEWYDFSGCLPHGVVSSITINEEARLIRASLTGFGIWEANLAFCPDNISLNLTAPVTANSNRYEASNTIVSTQNLVNAGTIDYRAGNIISLQSGFRATHNFDARVFQNVSSCQITCYDFVDVSFTKGASSIIKEDPSSEGLDDEPDINIQTYPNPTQKVLNVVVNGTEDEEEYTIYVTDISGKKLLKESFTNGSCQLDVSSLEAGNYVLMIEEAGKEHSKLIIIK
jgi:hypothetical protein